ncbi:hypothetical protein FNV43_RR00641 [Rhamnella rubrinervis]|uniref:Uncharacterized protein n=1 Tax=Rhamnella rubrinervis TaxID=2594499 RepID=A0A8K0HR16_9ROSA|nr:hypothetical protein FNV43_RR00641 [Rhamnella rubrinervis]
MPVVEPVAMHTATSRRESSSASYIGRRSHRGSVTSTSGGRYHDIGLDDNSARRELEGRRQEIAIFILSFGSRMPRFPRNIHPEPESSSWDATSRLVEAIERLVAHNVQQQQPWQQQQPAGINAVVKQFRDLHPPEFDGSMNPLVAEVD